MDDDLMDLCCPSPAAAGIYHETEVVHDDLPSRCDNGLVLDPDDELGLGDLLGDPNEFAPRVNLDTFSFRDDPHRVLDADDQRRLSESNGRFNRAQDPDLAPEVAAQMEREAEHEMERLNTRARRRREFQRVPARRFLLCRRAARRPARARARTPRTARRRTAASVGATRAGPSEGDGPPPNDPPGSAAGGPDPGRHHAATSTTGVPS